MDQSNLNSGQSQTAASQPSKPAVNQTAGGQSGENQSVGNNTVGAKKNNSALLVVLIIMATVTVISLIVSVVVLLGAYKFDSVKTKPVVEEEMVSYEESIEPSEAQEKPAKHLKKINDKADVDITVSEAVVAQVSETSVLNTLRDYYMAHHAELSNGAVIGEITYPKKTWWRTDEGYLIYMQNAHQLDIYFSTNGYSWAYDFLGIQYMASVFMEVMEANSFKIKTDMTTDCTQTLDCQIGYESALNDVKCLFEVDNSGEESNENNGINVRPTISCFQFDDSEDYMQDTYLKELEEEGLNVDNCGITDYGMDDYFAWFNLQCGMTNIQAITKLVDEGVPAKGHQLIWSGQGNYPCSLKEDHPGVDAVVHYDECDAGFR